MEEIETFFFFYSLNNIKMCFFFYGTEVWSITNIQFIALLVSGTDESKQAIQFDI
jgi:hypothetical protein